MRFDDSEREIIINALKNHLEEVEMIERFPNQNLKTFATEVQYRRMVSQMIKKLKN